ncbi:hypothetical protein D3C80_1974030 [compost metagenome]
MLPLSNDIFYTFLYDLHAALCYEYKNIIIQCPVGMSINGVRTTPAYIPDERHAVGCQINGGIDMRHTLLMISNLLYVHYMT